MVQRQVRRLRLVRKGDRKPPSPSQRSMVEVPAVKLQGAAGAAAVKDPSMAGSSTELTAPERSMARWVSVAFFSRREMRPTCRRSSPSRLVS